MADLAGLLDALDRAVAHAAPVLEEDRIEPAARVARTGRRRKGFLGDTVVLALAGGTGSGKSSLLNALAGEKVAETGPRRPVTDRPLAWIPAQPEPGLVRLLDDLGIDDRVGQDRFPHLAVLDLPDFDSVVAGHRLTVDELLPRVDAVAWVLDPEKYNDRVVHHRYLRPDAGHRERFVFVLNQIDRLPEPERDQVRAHLSGSLAEDGIDDPRVFLVAADPSEGPPQGLEALEAFLAERLEAKRLVLAKLTEDVRRAGRHLAEEAGVERGASMDLGARWGEARDGAASRLGEMAAGREVARVLEAQGRRTAAASGGGPLGRLAAKLARSPLGRALGGRSHEEAPRRISRRWSTRPGLEETVGLLTELVTELSFEAGGAFGARVREQLGPVDIEGAVRESVEQALDTAGPSPEPQPAGWWRLAGPAQTILLLTLAAGALWGWARPEALERGRWPWPVILVGGALVAIVLLSRLVRGSGRRAGRRAAASFREEVERRIGEELDERLGTPLRRLLRDRALLAAALAELGVEAERARR